ncbi:hypothetical protein AQUCO_00600262v1 [Aquilegia coerulea]|uniref:Glutaredoxin domain-containing protein n=1 Tax=Aquilegia coerulea TaxID=218851 RepID=A0A2G5ENX1_AQUCA|nr:hypothetical protein AQUCO_00600262v1 [Aquilegia coerulea]
MFEKGQLDELIFNCGIKEENKESAKTLCMAALLCVQYHPTDRPPMSTVIKILEGDIHIRPSQLLNPFPYYYSQIESSLGGDSTSSYQHILSPDFHKRLHEGSIQDTEEDFTHTEFGSSSMSRQPLGGTGTPADVMINSIKIDSDTTTTSELKASTQKELEEYFEKVPVSPTLRSSPTIASIHQELKKHFKKLENSVVIYTTSLGAISKTVEECEKVRKILLSRNIQMSERDLWTNPEYREELKKLLGKKDIKFPVVFVKGRLIGGADELQKLEEDNELGTLFDGISATTLV